MSLLENFKLHRCIFNRQRCVSGFISSVKRVSSFLSHTPSKSFDLILKSFLWDIKFFFFWCHNEGQLSKSNNFFKWTMTTYLSTWKARQETWVKGIVSDVFSWNITFSSPTSFHFFHLPSPQSCTKWRLVWAPPHRFATNKSLPKSQVI